MAAADRAGGAANRHLRARRHQRTLPLEVVAHAHAARFERNLDRWERLSEADPEISRLIREETRRQAEGLELNRVAADAARNKGFVVYGVPIEELRPRAPYDFVVLSDVPAEHLSIEQMDVVERYLENVRANVVDVLSREQLEQLTGKEARTVVLGHLLRGGTPTASSMPRSGRNRRS